MYQSLPLHSLQKLFYISLALTALLGGALLAIPLKTDITPMGIVTYQFIDSLEHAQQIFAIWGVEGKAWAMFSLGLDYGFLLCYGLCISVAIFLVSKLHTCAKLTQLGSFLCWSSWLCSLLDAVENTALLALLTGHQLAILPNIAFSAASIKFIWLAVCLLYVATICLSKRKQEKIGA